MSSVPIRKGGELATVKKELLEGRVGRREQVDALRWHADSGFPLQAGFSMSLDPELTDEHDRVGRGSARLDTRG
jgi:hypothetical protein